MKKVVDITFILVFGFSFFIVLTGYLSSDSDEGEWVAPKSADQIKNPLVGNATATKEGKKLFQQMCAICHGNKGKGDGIAGMNLKPRPTNLSQKSIQAQTDGAIFWKLTEGRAPMASYKQALKENQRWQLVNYIRDLAAK